MKYIYDLFYEKLRSKTRCWAPIIFYCIFSGCCSIINILNKATSREQKYSTGWREWNFGIGEIENFSRDFGIWPIFSLEIGIQYPPWWAPLKWYMKKVAQNSLSTWKWLEYKKRTIFAERIDSKIAQISSKISLLKFGSKCSTWLDLW